MKYDEQDKQLLDMLNRTNFQHLSHNDLLIIKSKLSKLKPDVAKEIIEQFPQLATLLSSVCSTKPLPKSRTTLDTRGERLRCFEFDEMDGI